MHRLVTGSADVLRCSTGQWVRCLSHLQSCSTRLAGHDNASSTSWISAICAVTTAAVVSTAFPAHADSPAQPTPDEAAAAEPASFQDWVKSNGGDAAAVYVGQSKDPYAGNALFADPEKRPGTKLGKRLRRLRRLLSTSDPLATFPLSLALTMESAMADPLLGANYQELHELGLAGERQIVILMLLIEKLRGADSKWAPYIQLLPTSFSSPVWYSQQQMEQLSGTNLAAAAAALRRGSEAQWKRLAPAATDMLRQVGVLEEPKLEDWLWATAAFWSRAQSLPVPKHHNHHRQQQQQQDESSSSSSPAVVVLEGLVPGVDFCNHSFQPSCWWEVVNKHQAKESAPNGADAAQPVVQLMSHKAPKRGSELTISYGDKGNEELLLLHGFAVPDNPYDTLMVPCPLPPSHQWGADTAARVQLLQVRGLTPQLFLTRKHLEALPSVTDTTSTTTSSSSSSKKAKSNTTASTSSSSIAAATVKQRQELLASSCLPEQARQTLAAFVMDMQEVVVELEAAEEQLAGELAGGGGASSTRGDHAHATSSSRGSSSSSRGAGGGRGSRGQGAGKEGRDGDGEGGSSMKAVVDQLGLDMAIITTFVRLLELQLLNLEGPEGTGPLEEDLRKLAQLQQQQEEDGEKEGRGNGGVAAAAEAGGDDGGVGWGSVETLGSGRGQGNEEWLRACLLYRAGQKELVRGYLVRARAELSNTMALLRAAVGDEAAEGEAL